MRYLTGGIKGVLLIALVLFCVFNTQQQEVVILKGYLSYNVPVFVPALLALFIGFVAANILFIKDRIAAGKEIKQLKKELADAGYKINHLQNLPLNDVEPENDSDKGEENA